MRKKRALCRSLPSASKPMVLILDRKGWFVAFEAISTLFMQGPRII